MNELDPIPFCPERNCRDNVNHVCHFDGSCPRKFFF